MAVDEATTADAAPDSLNDAPPVTEEKSCVTRRADDASPRRPRARGRVPGVRLPARHGPVRFPRVRTQFTYDHVYHGAGPTEKALYDQCVEPLVNGLLAGYNATVLAYGQTGSGEAHTMGFRVRAWAWWASSASCRPSSPTSPRFPRRVS